MFTLVDYNPHGHLRGAPTQDKVLGIPATVVRNPCSHVPAVTLVFRVS